MVLNDSRVRQTCYQEYWYPKALEALIPVINANKGFTASAFHQSTKTTFGTSLNSGEALGSRRLLFLPALFSAVDEHVLPNSICECTLRSATKSISLRI